MRIRILPVLSLILLILLSSCKDELQEMPVLQKRGAILESNIDIIPQEELTTKSLSLSFKGNVSKESSVRSVGFKSVERRGSSSTPFTFFEWEHSTWAKEETKPSGLLIFKGPKINGKSIAFYYKLKNTDITFTPTSSGATLRFDLTTLPVPQGVTSLEGWSVAGIIVDNPADVEVHGIEGKVNFDATNKLACLEDENNNKLSIPFGFSFVRLKSTSVKNFSLERKLDIRPLGTLIYFRVYNDLISNITPKKMKVSTNAFTTKGALSFNMSKSTITNNVNDIIGWKPDEGQIQVDDINDKNIYALSPDMFYDIKKLRTIQSTQSGDRYMMWVMPTPHGQVVKVSFELTDIYGYSSFWSNKTHKIGLLASSKGRTIQLGEEKGIPITADLMIASVYQHSQGYEEEELRLLSDDANYCYGVSGKNNSMIELYNPTAHPIALKDYFISRVVYYLRENKDLPNFYFGIYGNEECERQGGKAGYSFHPYGYYYSGNNWNGYGINPMRYEQSVKYLQLFDTDINLGAVQFCCDVTAFQHSRSIVGDRVYYLKTDSKSVAGRNNTPINDLSDVWNTETNDWGVQTCPVYYSIQSGSWIDDDKLNISNFTIERDYEFPVEYKAMPMRDLGKPELSKYDLSVLQPGKTLILGAGNFIDVFKKNSNIGYPYNALTGVESLKNNILNGSCQAVVGADDGGFNIHRYSGSYHDWHKNGTPSSSKDIGTSGGFLAGTLQLGPANGLVLSKREVRYDGDGQTPVRIFYNIIDRFGPTDVQTGNYTQEYRAWKKFCTEELPNDNKKTRIRWYFSRRKNVQKPNDIWTIGEWYSAVKEKGKWTEEDYDLGNHDPNTSKKR